MKRVLQILAAIALSLGALGAHAQREFNQGELDAVLAPIALYPDPLVIHILNASVFPQDVATAAAWSRANPQLQGDAALAAVEGATWHPSVKALVAYPDVLSRMVESPQWLADLGEAYTGSPDAVNAEIQQLRARAQATGNLQSNAQQYVYQQGQEIVVQPVYPGVIYAPYYNPYIVYGAWWWPAYRPVYWRPWVWRPVVVTRVVAPVRIVHPVHPGRAWQHPAPVVRQPVHVTPYRPVPESRRQPIIQSRTQPLAAAPSMPQGHITRWQQARPTQHTQMPAPQWRATERPARTLQAHSNGNRSAGAGAGAGQGNRGGNGNGGGKGNGGGRHKS